MDGARDFIMSDWQKECSSLDAVGKVGETLPRADRGIAGGELEWPREGCNGGAEMSFFVAMKLQNEV